VKSEFSFSPRRKGAKTLRHYTITFLTRIAANGGRMMLRKFISGIPA